MFPSLSIVSLVFMLSTWLPPGADAKTEESPALKAEFLRLCGDQCEIIDRQSRAEKREGRAFYWDSYVVRALCVAYDMTGNEKYLDVCKRWSDRMLDDQSRMIPKGAYYMQYGREPGQNRGNWYVADSASIAMGILATAVRCEDSAEKTRYLNSVKAFAKLVMDNYARPSGGITNGHWPKSDQEWWCSTGCFGSLAFLLYAETDDESYLRIGLGAIDWLNRQDFLTVAVHYPPEVIKPTVMTYCLEAYSAGFPHLEPGSDRFRSAMAQWAKTLDWITHNQGGRAGIDYTGQWGSKLGGLPFHMYVYASHVSGSDEILAAADKELRYIATLLEESPASHGRDQLAIFALMSYAQKLSPGTLYRSTRK